MKYMGGWTYDDLMNCPARLVDAIHAEMQAEAEERRRSAANRKR